MLKKNVLYLFIMQFLIMVPLTGQFNVSAGILNRETARVPLQYETFVKMHVDKSTVYIGGYSRGQLYIIDATDKRVPLLRSTTTIPDAMSNNIHDIWYSNNMVYLTHRNGGVSKIDVSNQTTPIVYSRCMPTGYTHNGIKASFSNYLNQEVLYVADHYGSVPLKIFNPQTNQLIGNAPYDPATYDGREIEVTSDGIILYQSTWAVTPKIRIYNVQNPSSPQLLNSINTFAQEMVISPDNRYLYIVYDQNADAKFEGVMIIDISNPSSPTIVNTISLPGARDLTVDHNGHRLFVRTRSDVAVNPVPLGIYAYDISNLNSITQIDFLPTIADRSDFDLWYENEYLYYADYTSTGSYLIISHVGARQPNRAPIANSGSITTNEDVSVSFKLSASDPDDDVVTYTVVQSPSNGVLTGTAPNLTYKPNTNFNGNDQFRFSVTDGEFHSEAILTITVNPVDDRPVIEPVPAKTIGEGSSLEFKVNVTDVDNDPLTYNIIMQPAGSSFINNTFSWTPNYNQAGNYYFYFSVTDQKSTLYYSVQITVTNVNRAPVANAQSVTVIEDNLISISLSGSDPDGNPITYQMTSNPEHGTLSGTIPNLTYTPNPNYNGPDVFKFTVSDGTLSSEATVSISINAANDVPALNPIAAQSGVEMSVLTFVVTGSDIDGDALTFSASNLPDGASFNNGTFSWTPSYIQSGTYTITVFLSDGKATVSQDVSINVENLNRAPVANTQNVTTDEDKSVAITLSGNDPDGDAISFGITYQPIHGTLSGTVPNLTYTPNANYNGTDAIKFTVSDGNLNSESTVSITVNAVNDAPVLSTIPVQSGVEMSAITFTAAGSDVDGDALTFSASNLPEGATFTNSTFNWTPTYEQAGTYSVIVTVSDGKVTATQNVQITIANLNRAPVANALNITTDEDKSVAVTLSGSDPDGEQLSYTIIAQPSHGTLIGTAPNLTYTPDANYNGRDEITFSVSDGALSSEAIVSINVNAINDAPVLNTIAAQSVEETSTLTFTATGSDIDADALTFSATNLPAGAEFNNGIFTWTPSYVHAGSYTITVSLSDGNATVTQDVAITVANLNRVPVANAQSVTTDEDNATAVTLTGSDPDGENLSYTVVNQPARGTLSGTAPNLTYTPDANYNGRDEITFSVNDGFQSAEATVSINVNAINDAPVLSTIAAQSVEETSTLTFTATGSDIDADALTFSAVNLPEGATFDNETFTWTPTYVQAGAYTITVSLSDGNASVTQDVAITVANLNRAPVANAQSVNTDEDNATTVTLTGSDPDGEVLNYTVVNQPSHGTLSGTAPNLTYTPDANYNGSDEITFSVSDGALSSDAIVSITVNAINDAPVLNTIAAQSVEETSTLTFTATGSDIDADALTFSASNLPEGATFDKDTFTWTPTFVQAGSYTITITLTDGNATVTQDVAITVANLNRAPVAIAQSVTTDEDNATAVTLTGSDPDGENLSYTVVAQPSHGTLSGTAPNLTYTPVANYNGSDEITYSVIDGSLSAEAVISISVKPVNDAPVVNTIPAKTVNENSLLTFSVTGSDVDGDFLTYSASNLPTWATFTNGTFAWTPAFDQAGSYSITVTAFDGKLSSSRNVTISVINTAVKAKVYMYDEAMSNPVASNPRLYVVNTSSENITDCRVEYYFTSENGKTPILDQYYTANAKVTLASRGNGDYTIVYDLTGISIAPGAIYPNAGGMVVGIHYQDWSNVDVMNDYSNNRATSYAENSKICVYKKDNSLSGGLKPSVTGILPFANAGSDLWSTSQLVTLDGSRSYDLLGQINSYAWIINGNVVSSSVKPSITFNYGVTTVTLRVTNTAGLISTDEVNVYVHKDTDVLFALSNSPVPVNTPVTIEYNVPSKVANASIVLEAQNVWGGTNVLTLSGTAGYHKELIWSWNKNAFGGSGPWTVKCKVNGVVKQTLLLKFGY